ncbi:KH-likey domain-containing 1 isoform X2 [Sigmodon hispidus]
MDPSPQLYCVSFLDLPSSGAGGALEMNMNNANENAWWMVPENFDTPFVMLIDEGQEEHIFGPGDLYLRRIEVHSNTLIQLEGWFTASGQTRVTVVGPLPAKRWLMNMFWSVGCQEAYHQAQGLEMLNRVRNQPLTHADLDTSLRVQAYNWGLSPPTRMKGTS